MRGGDAADLLCEMIGPAAARSMDIQVGAWAGAGCGEKSAERLVRRNCDRERDRETRAGTAELRVPRKVKLLSGFLEQRRKAEKALTAVIQEACIRGI